MPHITSMLSDSMITSDKNKHKSEYKISRCVS